MRYSGDFKLYYLIQVWYGLALTFSWYFAFLYQVQIGLSYFDIIVFRMCSWFFGLMLMFSIRRFQDMKMMSFGMFGFSILLFGIPYATKNYLLFFLGLVDGLTYPLFWISYNCGFFGLRRVGESAYHASLLFIVFPLLGIVGPIVGGYVIDTYGAKIIFHAGGALIFFGAIALLYSKTKPLAFNPMRALADGKGLRTLIFIEGFWQGVDWVVAALYTLTFLNTGEGYGGFLSYVAVLGALSTLSLSRRSDKSGERKTYVYPVVIILSIATLLCAFTKGLFEWVILRGIIGCLVAIMSPFTMSIVLDRPLEITDSMHMREIMLALGRLFGNATSIFCMVILGNMRFAFILSSAALILYPLIVETKKLYPSKIMPETLLKEQAIE